MLTRTLVALAAVAFVPTASADTNAQTDMSFSVAHDPGGAPMCFAANGELAPLANCSFPKPEKRAGDYYKALDPSGAPMCFAANGEKAPLSTCTPVEPIRQNYLSLDRILDEL